jgi:hypothetical protein
MPNRNIFAAIALALVVSTLVALSPYHVNLNADTMVIFLHSIIKWTPFLWGQDRQGMLVQGMTVWIGDPVLNIVVQTVLHILTSIFSFFLLANFLFPRSNWFWIGAASLFAFVGLSGTGDLYDYFTPWQNYSVSLMFGLLAFHYSSRSKVFGFLLLCLSQWSMFSTNVLLVMLLGLKEFFGRPGKSLIFMPSRESRSIFGLIAVSSVVGYFLRMNAPNSYPSDYSILPMNEALLGWKHLLEDYFLSSRSSPWLILLPAALGIILFIYLRVSRQKAGSVEIVQIKEQWQGCKVGLSTAALYALVVGSSRFASAMGFPRRYLIPSLMIWVVSWVGLLFVFKSGRSLREYVILDSSRIAGASLAILTAAVLVLFRFGSPSYSGILRIFDQKLSPQYQEVVQANCTHLVGTYYRVWDSVFYSRIVKAPPLWGISDRAQPTRQLWDLELFPEARVCYWQSEENEANALMKMFNISDLERLETVGNLVVLVKGSRD